MTPKEEPCLYRRIRSSHCSSSGCPATAAASATGRRSRLCAGDGPRRCDPRPGGQGLQAVRLRHRGCGRDGLPRPHPGRLPRGRPCGGCSLRHLRYQAELQAKEAAVADAFRRIGGLDVEVQPILPSPEVDRYRNKVQYPVGWTKTANPASVFTAGRSHRIVPCADCKLQPAVLNEIGHFLCGLFAQYGIQPYDEASGSGLVRHIFLRRGAHSGQIMVCLVCTRPRLPHAAELNRRPVQAVSARVRTVLINVNPDKTNVILGRENRVLYGPGFIEDTLCGVPVRLGPLSFYQVNTPGAEQLYGVAAAYAAPGPDDLLLDLYCGMGTIGLSMAERCRALVGVEVVPEAIESAKANAARMGDAIAAKSRFLLRRRRRSRHPPGRRGPDSRHHRR